jgi:hypothetical protein
MLHMLQAQCLSNEKLALRPGHSECLWSYISELAKKSLRWRKPTQGVEIVSRKDRSSWAGLRI